MKSLSKVYNMWVHMLMYVCAGMTSMMWKVSQNACSFHTPTFYIFLAFCFCHAKLTEIFNSSIESCRFVNRETFSVQPMKLKELLQRFEVYQLFCWSFMLFFFILVFKLFRGVPPNAGWWRFMHLSAFPLFLWWSNFLSMLQWLKS